MKLTPLIVLLSFVYAQAQNWEFSDIARGVKPGIAVDSKGQPHIAYMLEDISGFVDYALGQAGIFTITRVEVGYHYGPLDICLDQNDIPNIVFHDHNDGGGDLNHAHMVAPGTFAVDRVPHGGHDGWDGSIAIDDQNNPHVMSIDPGSGVEYARKNGTWTVESIGSERVMYANATTIAISSNGEIHSTFYDDRNGDLKYARRSTNGTWTIETVENEGDVGRFSSLVLDKDDRPHVSYYKVNTTTTGTIRYAHWDGAWSTEEVDVVNSVRLGFTGARKMTSILMDQNDAINIAYCDQKTIKIARMNAAVPFGQRNNAVWQYETVLNVSGSNTLLGQQVDMAMDDNGGYHLTYFEVTNTASLDGRVKYGYKSSLSTNVEELSDPELRVYPNPVATEVTVEFPRITDSAFDLQIFDVRGVLVRQVTRSKGQTSYLIDIRALEPGIYYARIRGKGFEQVARFIRN